MRDAWIAQSDDEVLLNEGVFNLADQQQDTNNSHSSTGRHKKQLAAGIFSAHLFLVLLLLLQLSWTTADFQLRQVHVVTRHGSRRPLAKDALTMEETISEDSLLTPLGQEQHYQLGRWLRDRYAPKTQSTSHNEYSTMAREVLQDFDPRRVRFESSSYERTLASAEALALGLFPAETRGSRLIPDIPPVVPVYSEKRVNDIDIRAYDKCPTYTADLKTKLYESSVWHDMEQDALPLLRKLARLPNFIEYVIRETNGGYVPLIDLWNVYDDIHVAKIECASNFSYTNTNDAGSEVCRSLPDPTLGNSIAPEDWEYLQQVSHAVELLKYGSEMAENKLGGPWWNTFAQRVKSMEYSSPATTDNTMQNDHFVNLNDGGSDNANSARHSLMATRFYVTSAHYPTILGLFAALNIPFSKKEDPVIPEYASAFIVEVYQDTSNFQQYVNIFYKSIHEAYAIPVDINTNCKTDDATRKACPLDEFMQVLQTSALLTPAEWCLVCENTKADVCLSQALLRQSQSQNQNGLEMTGLFFLGMLAMALVMSILSIVGSSRLCGGGGVPRRRRGSQQQKLSPQPSHSHSQPQRVVAVENDVAAADVEDHDPASHPPAATVVDLAHFA